jgi:hypothetical protein
MVKAIGDKLGVDESRSPELPELERDVEPEAVLQTMERTRRRMRDDPGAQPGAATDE